MLTWGFSRAIRARRRRRNWKNSGANRASIDERKKIELQKLKAYESEWKRTRGAEEGDTDEQRLAKKVAFGEKLRAKEEWETRDYEKENEKEGRK